MKHHDIWLPPACQTRIVNVHSVCHVLMSSFVDMRGYGTILILPFESSEKTSDLGGSGRISVLEDFNASNNENHHWQIELALVSYNQTNIHGYMFQMLHQACASCGTDVLSHSWCNVRPGPCCYVTARLTFDTTRIHLSRLRLWVMDISKVCDHRLATTNIQVQRTFPDAYDM